MGVLLELIVDSANRARAQRITQKERDYSALPPCSSIVCPNTSYQEANLKDMDLILVRFSAVHYYFDTDLYAESAGDSKAQALSDWFPHDYLLQEKNTASQIQKEIEEKKVTTSYCRVYRWLELNTGT